MAAESVGLRTIRVPTCPNTAATSAESLSINRIVGNHCARDISATDNSDEEKLRLNLSAVVSTSAADISTAKGNSVEALQHQPQKSSCNQLRPTTHEAHSSATGSQRVSPSVPQSESPSDDESEQEISSVFRKTDHYLMPNKSQVLYYLTDTSLLRIRKTGTELQVTDSIGFPLFDIWIESDCLKSTWILESYGRTVLLITECTRIGCLSRKKSEPPAMVVTDWNDDIFGHFLPGDPFLIEDGEKQTLAKLIAIEGENARGSVWMCVLEGSGKEVARLENFSTIVFAKEVAGFQLKLLTLAAFVRLTASHGRRTRSCCCATLASIFRC